MAKRKSISTIEHDEMTELEKFHDMKKQEQKALRKLLDELRKKAHDEKPEKKM